MKNYAKIKSKKSAKRNANKSANSKYAKDKSQQVIEHQEGGKKYWAATHSEEARADKKLVKSITKQLVGLLADLQILWVNAFISWNNEDEVVNSADGSRYITDDSWQFYKGAAGGFEEVSVPEQIRQALAVIANSLLQQSMNDWGEDLFSVQGTFEIFLPDGDVWLRLDLSRAVEFDTQVDDMLDYDMIDARKLHAILNGSNTTDVSAT